MKIHKSLVTRNVNKPKTRNSKPNNLRRKRERILSYVNNKKNLKSLKERNTDANENSVKKSKMSRKKLEGC